MHRNARVGVSLKFKECLLQKKFGNHSLTCQHMMYSTIFLIISLILDLGMYRVVNRVVNAVNKLNLYIVTYESEQFIVNQFNSLVLSMMTLKFLQQTYT